MNSAEFWVNSGRNNYEGKGAYLNINSVTLPDNLEFIPSLCLCPSKPVLYVLCCISQVGLAHGYAFLAYSSVAMDQNNIPWLHVSRSQVSLSFTLVPVSSLLFLSALFIVKQLQSSSLGSILYPNCCYILSNESHRYIFLFDIFFFIMRFLTKVEAYNSKMLFQMATAQTQLANKLKVHNKSFPLTPSTLFNPQFNLFLFPFPFYSFIPYPFLPLEGCLARNYLKNRGFVQPKLELKDTGLLKYGNLQCNAIQQKAFKYFKVFIQSIIKVALRYFEDALDFFHYAPYFNLTPQFQEVFMLDGVIFLDTTTFNLYLTHMCAMLTLKMISKRSYQSMIPQKQVIITLFEKTYNCRMNVYILFLIILLIKFNLMCIHPLLFYFCSIEVRNNIIFLYQLVSSLYPFHILAISTPYLHHSYLHISQANIKIFLNHYTSRLDQTTQKSLKWTVFSEKIKSVLFFIFAYEFCVFVFVFGVSKYDQIHNYLINWFSKLHRFKNHGNACKEDQIPKSGIFAEKYQSEMIKFMGNILLAKIHNLKPGVFLKTRQLNDGIFGHILYPLLGGVKYDKIHH
ncbi:hypothetical protein VP01_2831g2 [Puccinia sorghi]|uniref:Uncharacterized protein n=1 Tax=Puccinia sorghi TaxID=27349 RepID=A0A0L6V409_9BASI|nr:hypothetical protein VP01_2831g2 [Puccinia sorghi]